MGTASGQVLPKDGPSQKLEFDVASVRPSARDARQRGWLLLFPRSNIEPRSGLFSANLDIVSYLMFAYDIHDHNAWLPIHLPEWAAMNNWDIEARSEEVPTRAQLKLMIRSLLQDRFKLALHIENRKMPVYAMRLAKLGQPGPMLKPHTSQQSCANFADDSVPTGGGIDQLYCGGQEWDDHDKSHHAISDVSMDQLAGFLSDVVISDRRIVNQTGLDGRYDIHIVYPAMLQASGQGLMDYIFAEAAKRRQEFEKQLGIRLIPTTAEVPVLVVDHIEKPSPN